MLFGELVVVGVGLEEDDVDVGSGVVLDEVLDEVLEVSLGGGVVEVSLGGGSVVVLDVVVVSVALVVSVMVAEAGPRPVINSPEAATPTVASLAQWPALPRSDTCLPSVSKRLPSLRHRWAAAPGAP